MVWNFKELEHHGYSLAFFASNHYIGRGNGNADSLSKRPCDNIELSTLKGEDPQVAKIRDCLNNISGIQMAKGRLIKLFLTHIFFYKEIALALPFLVYVVK